MADDELIDSVWEELPLGVYVCSMCGFRYDESRGSDRFGIKPGTRWADVPNDFVCPLCQCPKNIFKRFHDGGL